MKMFDGVRRIGFFRIVAVLMAAALLVTASIGFAGCEPTKPGEPGATDTAGPDETPGADDSKATFTVAEGGASEYKFVIGNIADFGDDAVKVASERLKKSGISIPVAAEGETPAHRILVETSEDMNDPEGGILSFEGYRITADKDNNITITGGNLESTGAGVEYFRKMFKDGSLKLEEGFEYNFHPFKKGGSFRVAGTPIDDFKVVAQAGDTLAETAAKYIEKLLFTSRGVYIGDNDGSLHTISFEYGADDAMEGSVRVEGGNIVVKGSKKIGLYRLFREFLEFVEEDEIADGTSIETEFADFISYEDFGAVGDGVTDDSKAIKEAHDQQKETGKPIFAREDATYYIGKNAKVSRIGNDVDWSTAHFIIDDSELKSAGSNIFTIPAASKSSSIKNDLKKVAAGAESLGVTLTAKSMVTITNDGVKQYIRKGANQDAGSSQKEVIICNEDGTVDPSTPVIWDFKKVTSATAVPVDDPVIIVRGGIFTTIANQAASNYTYYNRGIEIQRSNAVIRDVAHYITGEGDTGAPYNGFLMISNTYNLTVMDTILTPHKTYYTQGTGGFTPMGSYDCQVTSSIGLNFVNVIQSRSINDMLYWGTFASNYSRNITFDGCIIGRFDAHKSVCNVTLKNCSFGHQGINLIGQGTALIENCNIYGRNIINLRDDYGSTWDGDIVIKNCTYYPGYGIAQVDAELIGGTNTFDHNFGYTCYLPKNVTIDGLYVNDSQSLEGLAPMLYANINPDYNSADYKAKYPMVIETVANVKNFESYSGKSLEISRNGFMFANVKLEIID